MPHPPQWRDKCSKLFGIDSKLDSEMLDAARIFFRIHDMVDISSLFDSYCWLMSKKKPKKSGSKGASQSRKNRSKGSSMTNKKSKPSGGGKKSWNKITTSSTAEYFSKNLQQVGFSSQTKAVLTTVKEAVDNALDACEDHDILPEITVTIAKKGAGSLKNSDQIMIRVEDNGPGLEVEDVTKVFGEYLASSKFGRGRCSRGQQGIGISAAVTWAQLTSATGVKIKTKTDRMRKAISCVCGSRH